MTTSIPSPGRDSINKDIHTSKVGQETSVSRKPLLGELPFANLSELTSAAHLFTSKTGEGDALLKELEDALNLQANQIEQELEKLEKNKKNQELTDVIIETENLGEWAVEKFGSANESVASGVEFLEHMIPPMLLEKLPTKTQLEKVGALTTLGGAFLTALSSGLSGLALIYKIKILERSKEVLKLMKEEAQENRDSTVQKSALSTVERNERDKAIAEWELNIEMEEESIAEELLEFKLSSASTIIYLANLPFTFFPEALFSESLKLASAAAPWLVASFETLALGLELKKTTEEAGAFNQWKEDFLKWKNAHAAQWSEIIKSVESLRDKRNQIMTKKLELLQPQFEKIKGKIEELKEGAFIREMQGILWGHLQDPNCTPEMIKEIMKTWGFDGSSAAPKAAALLQAIDAFEGSKEAMPPVQKEAFIEAFSQWMNDPAEMKEQFQRWFQEQAAENRDDLLTFYALHQETIEVTTKNALKQMVEKKHEIESRFIHFKQASSWIEFSVSALILAVTAALAILALLSIPFGGAAVLLIALSVASSVISFGLFGAGYIQAFVEKPHVTRLLSLRYKAKLLWARLGASISQYSQQTKEKKLLEVAKVLHQLHLKLQSKDHDKQDYEKALQSYKNAKQEFEKSQEKAANWAARLKRLENTIQEKSWEDFVKQASLQIHDDSSAFDTLRAFQEALNACDLNLLSEETKSLLKIQLGLDLKALQAQMDDDPDAIREALQEFFVLDADDLVTFITHQQQRMHRKLIEV